jgi:acylphosphatase
MPTLHLIIKGKVQGVFYRATAKETADQLGVTGWIKNTSEGDVEAVVTGSEKQLQSFVDWCKQGPRRANVSEVISTEQEETVFEDFTVIR